MPRWLSFTIIFLIGVYTLMLQSRDQLILYISPRYLLSATIAAIVCVVVAVVGYVWLIYKRKSSVSFKSQFLFTHFLEQVNFRSPKLIALIAAGIFSFFTPLGFVLLVIVILLPFSSQEKFLGRPVLIEFLVAMTIALGFILPAQVLSSQTASQRATSLNTIALNTELSATTLFSFNSDKFDVGDWIRRINVDPNMKNYVGKKVNITGFVFKPEEFPSDTFLASRFLISCCAVDARPVGLPVKFEGWDLEFQADQWVNVSGEFAISEVNGRDALVIIPADKPEKTVQPGRPYIY